MRPGPEPTRTELSTWRRLLAEARACANNPMRPTGELFERACKAAKACAPNGASVRDNPWFQMRDAAVGFCARKSERAALAPELRRRCDACPAEAATLRAPPAGRALPYRADLDG